jgi:Ca2+/H+ antiporter
MDGMTAPLRQHHGKVDSWKSYGILLIAVMAVSMIKRAENFKDSLAAGVQEAPSTSAIPKTVTSETEHVDSFMRQRVNPRPVF